MTKHRWNYSGDINLEYGGLFWREDGADDYVVAVQVTPLSDGGGPNNLYCIESGSIYMPREPDRRKAALSVIGAAPETATRRDYVEAFRAYQGIEHDTFNGETYVRIGKKEETRDWAAQNDAPDVVLRSNAKLRNYVRANHLT